MNNNVREYATADCGKYGKAMECAMTGADRVKAPGRADWRYLRKCFEIKTGAGELGNIGEKLVRGSSRVLYVPVVVEDADGSIDPHKQEGFILSREQFLEILDKVGLIREKTATNGMRKITIQTFWNRSRHEPHGTKYYRLLDELYANCDCTLEDFLNE